MKIRVLFEGLLRVERLSFWILSNEFVNGTLFALDTNYFFPATCFLSRVVYTFNKDAVYYLPFFPTLIEFLVIHSTKLNGFLLSRWLEGCA